VVRRPTKSIFTALVIVAVDRHEEAYKFLIASLKSSATYAPAFTSLGVYYSEYASPPDLNRSSKCFQKAFELDPREAFAARRLAEGFAEDREWDLVEVIARRTIEGEGGTDGGIKGTEAETAAQYLPTNTWAWKALGIVELVSIMFSYTQSSLLFNQTEPS
jgi:superkiller protein 3